MAEHTPGEWEARQHRDGSHWYVESYDGTDEYGYTTVADELSEGDAVFIAAAPDLLGACERLISAGERMSDILHDLEASGVDFSNLHENIWSRHTGAIESTREAIRKAKGE